MILWKHFSCHESGYIRFLKKKYAITHYYVNNLSAVEALLSNDISMSSNICHSQGSVMAGW